MRIIDSIRFRLTGAIFFLVLIITLLFGALTYRYEKLEIEERTFAQLNATADLKKEIIVTYVSERINDLKTLADEESTRASVLRLTDKGKDLPTTDRYVHVRRHLAAFKKNFPEYLSIEITDMRGNVIASSEGKDSSVSLEHREEIERHINILKEGGAVIMQDHLEQGGGRLDFAYGISDTGGNIRAVIISSIRLKDSLFSMSSDYAGLGYTGETLLVKKKGDDIIFINEPRHRAAGAAVEVGSHLSSHRLSRPAASGNEGIEEALDYRGKKVIGAYRYIPILQWGIVVKIDFDEAFEDINKLWKRSLIFSFAIIVFLLPLTLIVLSRFINPIIRISQKTEAIAAGDYSMRIDSKRKDEIGELEKHFDTMAEALEASGKEIEKKRQELEKINAELEEEVVNRTAEIALSNELLRQERDRVQKYLDIAGVMFIVLDVNRKVLLINKKGCEVLGYEESEILGKDWFESFLPERIRGDVRACCDKVTAGEMEAAEYFENPILTKAGEERLIAWHNAVVKNEKGETIGTLSSGEDITERKRAEEKIIASERFSKELTDVLGDTLNEVRKREGVLQKSRDAFLNMLEDVSESYKQLVHAYDSTIDGWSRALDYRDKETEGHSQRVTELTIRIASEMGITDEELIHVRRGALLHDIGKMGIPDAVLLKPGKLTDEEWVIMKQHPVIAYQLLSPISFLHRALDVPYCHHEKWDGTGYPRGLKGEEIPLAARIFAVVDVWDALLSNRPYRPPWPEEKVRQYMLEESGKQFDSKVLEAFFRMKDTNL